MTALVRSLLQQDWDWNLQLIQPPCPDENCHHYSPRSSRINLPCLRPEYLLALYSDAATAAGASRRLHKSAVPEPLPSRRRRIPNRRRLAPAYRTLRPSRLGFTRSGHCEHRPCSHLDGSQWSANGRRHFDLVSLSSLAVPRRVRGYPARLIRTHDHTKQQ